MLKSGIIIFIFLFVFLQKPLLSQQDSSSIHQFSYPFFHLERNDSTSYQPDSLLENLPNYLQRSALGNIALPSVTLAEPTYFSPLRIKWFSHYYQNDFIELENTPLFNVKKIFTSILGAAGSKKEQVLKFMHLQPINNQLNVSLLFNRYSCAGFYQNQQSFSNNLLLQTHYSGKKDRFYTIFRLTFNKVKHQENGGVSTDTLIEQDLFVNKQLVSVNLLNAKRNFREFKVLLNPSWKLNKGTNQSINHYIQVESSFSDSYSQYTDVPGNFYKIILLDSAKTNDSTHSRSARNGAAYELVVKKNWSIRNGVYYEAYYFNHSNHLVYENLTLTHHLGYKARQRHLSYKHQFDYIVSGANRNNFQFNTYTTYHSSFIKFSLNTTIEQRSPDLFYRLYVGNHNLWNNSFIDSKNIVGKLLVEIPSLKLKLSGGGKLSDYIIVLDTNCLPKQSSKGITQYHITINHHLKLYKIHFINQILFQGSNTTLLPLPAFNTFHQLYYEGKFYKNALRLQIGVQVNFISEFNSYDYNPAVNSFYLSSANKSNNYFFTDAFINAQINPVSFFFKTEHLNQGFNGMHYDIFTNYFQPDRSFKFGLRWEFND